MLNHSDSASKEAEYRNLIEDFLLKICADSVQRKDVRYCLCEYVECIEKWGSFHNIVSNQYGKIDLLKGVYDSLVGGAFIDLSAKEKVFDIGSGGGFPALPLAILYPGIQFFLVESNRKKCSFLRMVRSALGLKNVTILNQRVEDLMPQDMVISKAAFSAANLKLLVDTCKPSGQLALWSTPKSQDEIIEAALANGASLVRSHTYEMPNSGLRSILVFRRAQ